MNKSPLISIITPTLNSADKIGECLLSVTNQTCKNIEHLILDGLSTDDTLTIVRKFQRENNHIKAVSEKDNGIYDAMNKGIESAAGEWIYFLGSDDRLYNDAVVANIAGIVSQSDCEVIYGNVISPRFIGKHDGEFNASKILYKNICHQAVFIKKTVFDKVGLFNLRYKSHADWDHNMRWLLSPEVKKIFVDEIIAEYGDGGFSSLNYDVLFEKEKVLNFLQYGKKQIPPGFRAKLLFMEIKKSIRHFDLKSMFRIISKIPGIITGT